MVSITCPFCDTVNEAMVKHEEQDFQIGDIDPVILSVIVPVWACNVCDKQWTDEVAEGIRTQATEEFMANLRRHPEPLQGPYNAPWTREEGDDDPRQ